MTWNVNRVIEIIGEGVTDVGPVQASKEHELPKQGALPILVHKICNKPGNMRVIRKRVSHLRGKTLAEKIYFERFQAIYSKFNGLVLVVDSDGKLELVRKNWHEAREKSDAYLTSPLPMAIGVAHPCIESWLLADATAIRRGLDLERTPVVSDIPESLSPKKTDKNHPKNVFRSIVKGNVSSKDTDRIAAAMNDLEMVKKRCPLGFKPFADEVEAHIRPLFGV